jgi:haloalkane dehalogenase
MLTRPSLPSLLIALPLFTALAGGCNSDDAPGASGTPGAPGAPGSGPVACNSNLEVRKTPSGVSYVRTPDACFSGLPDWPFESRYVEIDGLRQGYVESGPADGPVILMLHGQPSWSYLYRFMIPVLAKAGFRAIAMDHIGMGLSDKPIDLEYHSFENHAKRLVAFMDALKLQKTTLFAQDWGSIVGLWVAGNDLARFDRMIIGNGGLPIVKEKAKPPADPQKAMEDFDKSLSTIPDNQPPFFDKDGNSLLPVGGGGDPFGSWQVYARDFEGFRPSKMLEALTFRALSQAERNAYDAPYPARIAMAAPRIFPTLRDQLIGITESRLEALKTYKRPFLTIFGGNDPGLVGEGDGQEWMKTQIPGAVGKPHERIPDASHFLQDDKGAQIAQSVISFIQANP